MRIVFVSGGCSEKEIVRAIAEVATMLAVKGAERVLIMETGKKEYGICEAFSSAMQKDLVREEMRYYSLNGFEYLIQKCQMGELDPAEVRNNCDTVLKDSLYVLPVSGAEKYTGLTDLKKYILEIAGAAESFTSVILIDASSGEESDIADYGDLCVVCMGENEPSKEQKISEYVNVFGENKVFYLICNDRKLSVYNRINLKRIYSLKDEMIADIGWNEKFMAAYEKGRAGEYIYHSVKNPFKDAVARNYLDSLYKASLMIREAAAYG